MKKIITVVMCLICLFVGARMPIVAHASASQDHPLTIWGQNQNSNYMTLNVVDEATGVNYIVVSATSLYGDKTTSVAITPRLNADGSLYVTD